VPDNGCDVVVGASAGGVEALSALVRALDGGPPLGMILFMEPTAA
jgi:chemotaxis response regulator CheB